MKKLMVTALLIPLILIGCITIEMGGDTETAAVEIFARRLAYHSAIKYPQMIEPGLKMCIEAEQAVASEPDLKAILYEALEYVGQEFVQDDPLLMDDIKSLASMINIQLEQPIVELTDHQRELIDIAIGSFRSGLLRAQEEIESGRANTA